jgi:hypothetical protein
VQDVKCIRLLLLYCHYGIVKLNQATLAMIKSLNLWMLVVHLSRVSLSQTIFKYKSFPTESLLAISLRSNTAHIIKSIAHIINDIARTIDDAKSLTHNACFASRAPVDIP